MELRKRVLEKEENDRGTDFQKNNVERRKRKITLNIYSHSFQMYKENKSYKTR